MGTSKLNQNHQWIRVIFTKVASKPSIQVNKSIGKQLYFLPSQGFGWRMSWDGKDIVWKYFSYSYFPAWSWFVLLFKYHFHSISFWAFTIQQYKYLKYSGRIGSNVIVSNLNEIYEMDCQKQLNTYCQADNLVFLIKHLPRWISKSAWLCSSAKASKGLPSTEAFCWTKANLPFSAKEPLMK